MNNFFTRLVVGSIALAIAIGATMTVPYPGYNIFFFLLVAGTISLACWELEQLCRAAKQIPVEGYATLSSLLFLSTLFCELQGLFPPGTSQLILLLGLLLLFIYHFSSEVRPIASISTTLLPVAYLTVPLCSILLIAFFFGPDSHNDSRWWLFFLLIVTKCNDVGGYFAGKLIGRHHLTKYISPNKTWEGSIAGLTMALLAAWLYYTSTIALLPDLLETLSLGKAMLIASAIALSSQLGDLSESLLKRDAGKKDSNVLPSLGGILDVLDALVFSAPLLYIFMRMIFNK